MRLLTASPAHYVDIEITIPIIIHDGKLTSSDIRSETIAHRGKSLQSAQLAPA